MYKKMGLRGTQLKVLGTTARQFDNTVVDGARVPAGNVVGLPCAVSTPIKGIMDGK